MVLKFASRAALAATVSTLLASVASAELNNKEQAYCAFMVEQSKRIMLWRQERVPIAEIMSRLSASDEDQATMNQMILMAFDHPFYSDAASQLSEVKNFAAEVELICFRTAMTN